MSIDRRVGIRISDFKAFGPAGVCIPEILPINVIIGRNNSGKSAILDALDYANNPRDIQALGHKGSSPVVSLILPIPVSAVNSVFQEGHSGGAIRTDHRQFGQKYIDRPIEAEIENGGGLVYKHMDDPPPENRAESLVSRMSNPIKEMAFFRLLADRDMVADGEKAPSLAPNGLGATNLIQHFINDSLADENLVKHDMLNALNEIFEPEIHFDQLQVQRLAGGGSWEVYLYEEGKGRIALSSSGSGLKTVLLVLCNTILMPRLLGKELEECVFALEELENNLHPGVQRRLLRYIEKLAADRGATFFLTTHSNVAIDLFSSNPDAQIIHVQHEKGESTSVLASDLLSRGTVLDDLDVRASDLLQANSVVWVEGPSDRVYINRIIELLYGDQLREGAHYQCVFYGGRLLARLSASDEGLEEFVQILKVNRHSVVLMDRDTPRINATKSRVKSELEANGGLAVITKGKEIECDLPLATLVKINPAISAPVTGLMSFHDYLETQQEGLGAGYQRDKVGFAQDVSVEMGRADISSSDVADYVDKIAKSVARWNQLSLVRTGEAYLTGADESAETTE